MDDMQNSEVSPELWDLASGACNGTLSAEDQSRLDALLAADETARHFYGFYMLMHAELVWRGRGAAAVPSGRRWAVSLEHELQFPVLNTDADDRRSSDAEQPSFIPPIVIDPSPAVGHPLLASLVAPGGFLFSYGMSAVIVVIGLLIGWGWRVSYDQGQRTAGHAARRPHDLVGPATKAPVVGRITGVADCLWADETTRAADRDLVPLGRTYAIQSGFLEITYNTGARVILQGPATFEIESASSGFLSLGRLAARVESRESRVENRGAKGERTVNPTVSVREKQPTASLALRPSSGVEGRESRVESRSRPSTPDSRLSTLNSPLFSVRTPSAVVTDLSTEFGVEVGRSGNCRAIVFQGEVQVRPNDDATQVIPLKENETAVIEARPGGGVKVTREHDGDAAARFVRQMPRQVRLKLFSTGVNLKEGDSDPHWQIVAQSENAKFKPRPAVVVAIDPRYYLPNDPARAQWISLAGNLSLTPRAVFTFRTTIELSEVLPDTAVVQGWFLVDNHVDAIRLNGKAVAVPEHDTRPPFDRFHSFTMRKGFVAGANVLEIDVLNLPTSWGEGTAMAMAVELQGFALRASTGPAAAATKESHTARK
jgi:hypothetical protein